MTFDQLIAKIDGPGGRLRNAADADREGPADDALAAVVVQEIYDAHDDRDADEEGQLRLALDLVDSMVRDLEAVRERIHSLWSPLAESSG